MTIQIRGHQTIAGLDGKVARHLLRKCRGNFCGNWLRDQLGVSEGKAVQIIQDLLREGYVECDWQGQSRESIPCYSATLKGRELMRASAAKPLKRSTARLGLDSFMNRVHQVNRASQYRCAVTKVAVFGSFLGGADRLSDVDVAVDIQHRIPLKGNWIEGVLQYARNSGRSFSSFDAELDWPRREILLFLKAKKRAISIQSWYSFTHMEKTRDFHYQVLLGDPEDVRHDLEKAEAERQAESTATKQDS